MRTQQNLPQAERGAQRGHPKFSCDRYERRTAALLFQSPALLRGLDFFKP